MYSTTWARPRFAMRFDRIAAPATEPVSLEDMRAACRVDDDDTSQDALISVWIAAAREFAEDYTGRSFITQTIRGTADAFPSACEPQDIWLKGGPVTAINQITYVDSAGALQTLDPAKYILDPSGPIARVAPAYGNCWPITQPQLGAVKVEYTAGYGNQAAVPKTARTWMQIRIATLYEHRKEVEVVPRGKLEPLTFVDGMLDSLKVSTL